MDLDEDQSRSLTPYQTIDVSKRRSTIQRPICFTDQEAVVLEEIVPDRSIETEYIWRKKMSRNIQTGSIKGIYTNTIKNFATKLTSS